jgi:diguanylate cyclase
MNYQDSVEQANEKLQKTLLFLKQYRLPASPINYAIAYEYISKENQELSAQISSDIEAGKLIDSFYCTEIFKQFLLHNDDRTHDVMSKMSALVSNTQKHGAKAQKDSSHYMSLLDEGLVLLDTNNVQMSRQVISKLRKATDFAKKNQQGLLAALRNAQQKAELLQSQLDDIQASKELDALTGLYNKKVLNERVDVWVQNKTEEIAAIAINLDHFKQFNDSYGSTIGNVILSKVAQKIKSYVNSSGVPARVSGEEFLVLIPEANAQTAQEVAERMRKGVEKLQFINAKSKEKLPKVTVSIGVTNFCHKQGLEGTIQKANSALQMAKATGRNRVYTH